MSLSAPSLASSPQSLGRVVTLEMTYQMFIQTRGTKKVECNWENRKFQEESMKALFQTSASESVLDRNSHSEGCGLACLYLWVCGCV